MRSPLNSQWSARGAVFASSLLLILLTATPVRAGDAPTLVKDINPAGSGSPQQLVSVGGTLYFTANDGVHGRELWKSDGTRAGTVMVRNIRTGSASSKPLELTNVAGTLFFTATDGVHGRELWKSDGTKAGTLMVRDIAAGSSSSIKLSQLTAVGQKLFFYRTVRVGTGMAEHYVDQVWVSNGTRAGTRLVYTADDELAPPANVAGKLFFAPAHGGSALRQTDGTVTTKVKGLPYGVLSNLTAVGTTLYFVMSDVNDDYALWQTDGTAAGTEKLAVVNSMGITLHKLGSRLVFVSGPDWRQLWVSNGTAGGTLQIADIGRSEDASWMEMVVANGELYFTTVEIGPNNHLWKTNGTTAGAAIVSDIGADFLTSVDGTLCFRSGDQIGESDGTDAGTHIVSAFADGANPSYLTAVKGTLFFSVSDGVHGRELWSYVP